MRCKICSREFKNFRELTVHLVKKHNYKAEDLYNYYGYSFETKEATCPICGKKFTMSWRQLKKHKDGTGRGITCGRACASVFMNLVYENPSCRYEVKEKKKQKALEKYGVENVFQAKEVKDKIKKSNLDKYGVEYPMQSSEIQSKSKETNLQKYGVEHVSQREDIKKRKIKRSLDKYGVENISQAEEVKEKKKQRALDKYGVDYTLQAPEIRDKIKETNLERYGFENAFQNEKIQEKAKYTNLERYGFEYASQSPEVQEKVRKTCLEKYGVKYAIASEGVKEKTRQTFLERYGVEYALQAPEVREKVKKTNVEKYGFENASSSPEVKEKVKKTNLEKFGVECPLKLPEIKEKAKETSLERYGVDHPMKSQKVKDKVKKTNFERYGTENGSQTFEAKEKRRKTSMDKYGVPHPFMSEEIKEKIKEHTLEEHGVPYHCQIEKCINANPHRISNTNKKFHKLLNASKIENELEYIIEGYGYDLRVGDTLIEINPSFTHNSTKAPCYSKKDPIPFDYHLNKTTFAKEHGFNCVHIFDWDDKDKIVNLLKPREVVYARKCEIKELERKEVNEFLEEYHLQGSTKQFKYAYGLYYENKLVQAMTFGKPRYNKNYEYELLRLCTVTGLKVIGGANKLLTYFEERVKPESIISYCDLSKFSGEVYEKLGFKLDNQTPPTKHWYNFKTKRHITDNLLRQRGFDQLHKASFGKGTSNEDLMREYGYVEIYDCGQLVFIKNLKHD